MDVTVGGVPCVVTEDGQHFLVANNSQYSIGLFETWKTNPEVITQPMGLQGVTFPPGWTGRCGFLRYPTHDKVWWDRFDAPQIPSDAGCDWAQSVDVKCIRGDGQAFTIGTLSAPFQTGILEGYFLPDTNPLNKIEYIYMRSTDLNPIPSGLKVTIKGFSYSEGAVADGFMVPIGDVEGEDRVYSRPTSVSWWGWTPCDLDVQYLAPASPPATCETQAAVDLIAESYDALVEQMQTANPPIPEIPTAPEVEKPSEWTGGTTVTEPTPDPNCVCSVSYHYIAKAIDTRGAEIAGEIRGLRREVVDLVTGVNSFLDVLAKQNGRNSVTIGDESREALEKIVAALYVNGTNPLDPASMTLSDLLASVLNHLELK